MPGPRIPDAIKTQVADRIAAFNREILRDPHVYYRARYQGLFLYLDRYDYGRVGRICRLQYAGALDDWAFAIYKYSDERYDPDEWLFPGAEELECSCAGACQA
jgi:hypothetical protein